MRHFVCFRSIVFCLLITLTLSVFLSTGRAENWPKWRGPNGDGVSRETGLPAEFGPDRNVAWKTPLPGPAGSTPIVWEDRIFLTSVVDDDMLLLCFDTESGKELWRRKVGSGNIPARGDEGNSAAPSPSTDGEHVWAFFGSGDLGCYDFDGREIWRYDIEEKYGKLDVGFVFSSTPVLDGDRLYLQLIHQGRHSLLCLDKKTGEEIWIVPRKSDARDECLHSYASPQLYEDDQRRFLLTHGADYVIAHDLEDGHEIWRLGGLHPPAGYDPTLRFVASPLAVPGTIVVPSAKKSVLKVVEPDGKGDITDTDRERWVYKTTPDVPCPLIHDGLVYLVHDRGTFMCLDLKTGEEYFNKRIHSARYRSSPIYADGKIYITARDGVIIVAKPGKTFKVLAENEMDEQIAASPAVSGGRIYLRSFDTLFAIEDNGE